MLTVSARFLAAIRQSHSVAVRATLIPPGETGAVYPVIGGQVSADRDARIRRQGTLTIPFSLSADLDAVRELGFGGYALVERGVTFADGTSELVPVGLLRVNSVSWDALQGQATLDLSDRMAQVIDEPFLTPYVPTGLKPTEAIVEAIEQVFGSTIDYHVLTDPASEAALVDALYEDDRGACVSDLAASIGASAFFDAVGDFVLRPMQVGGDPYWSFDAGPEGSLISVVESLDRSAVRNGVAVRGQAAADTPPVFALATDDDLDSPTLWGGPFGKVALIVRLTSVQTQAQADDTAAALLNLRLGLARALALRGLPNPALEPGDPIEIVYPDGRAEVVAINSITIPLDPAAPLEVTATGHFALEPPARERVFGAQLAEALA